MEFQFDAMSGFHFAISFHSVHMGVCPQASLHMVAVLQCLQRLTSSRFASADLVVTPNYAARIFAALLCGDDAVATEAARLLTRLWAPAAARTGRGPWQMGRTFTLMDDDPKAVNNNDDNLTARAGGWKPSLAYILSTSLEARVAVYVQSPVNVVLMRSI